MSPVAQLLCLILAANGSPILVRLTLGARLCAPIDGGHRFTDGRPLLGPSKTWAGFIAAIVAAGALAAAIGLPPLLGASIGLAAMAGDLASSFIKRRLGFVSSKPALILDQLPESLLPALVAAGPLALSGQDILLTVILFFLLEIALSHLLYRLGLREYPF